jgi:hypothetical protein
VTPLELEHGVPRFLEQLVVALRHEEANPESVSKEKPGLAESTRTANSDGGELFEQGYTIGEVVHGYGDVCQVITQLAIEMNAPVTLREFRTFNRLLDNAIADAVSSFISHRETPGAYDLHQHLGSVAEEQRKLLGAAMAAHDEVRYGNVGSMGATGNILEDSLKKLRLLIDKSLPEVRLATGMTNGVIPLPDRRVQQAGRRLGDAQFIGVRKVSK